MAEMAFNSLISVEFDSPGSSVLELLLFCLDLSIRRLSIMASHLLRCLLVAVGALPYVLSSAPILQPTPPMGYNNVGSI